jgi:Na+-translocating ferredoxin:NAD+ oxidoreductase RnfG subunit
MTHYHYNYNSKKVATKLIKVCTTTLLLALIEQSAVSEEITEEDKQQLENLLDEVL